MHLITSYPNVYLLPIRQSLHVNEIAIDYVYMHHTINTKKKIIFQRIYWTKKNCLLDMYLQPSKYVKLPLYPVENNLIILYNQEFSKDI